MKISVITVSFNAVAVIERTIKSVISQKGVEFEYIIVDGASTDGTVNIIRKYESRIAMWISEPDKGIYNAMNKATRMATGDFCIYMNAGDMFVNDYVLSRVYLHLDKETSVLSGNQVSVFQNKVNGYDRAPKKVDDFFFYRTALHHQATFFKTTDVLLVLYDESYRMISDWKLEAEIILKHSKTYKSMNIDICFFFQDGITYTNPTRGREERERAKKYLFSAPQLIHLKRRLNVYLFPINPLKIFRKLYSCYMKYQKEAEYRDCLQNLFI